MKFCLIDVSNLVHRAKHAVTAGPANHAAAYEDNDEIPENELMGLVLHAVFNSLRRVFMKFSPDHCVACFDSRSWRREVYEGYKSARRSETKTPKEEADHEMINRTIDELRDYFRDYTNVTVLECFGMEADDFIGRWVQVHDDPVFEHVILSNDSDFKQLVTDNVMLYQPLTSTLLTMGGVFYQDGRKIKSGSDIPSIDLFGEKWKVKIDTKTKEPIKFDPKWELFYKCIRGDVSDSIRSAYPRVLKTKMETAFYGDSEAWNNFINSSWGEDGQNSVREIYEFNKSLIDLTAQPEGIKEILDETIEEALNKPSVSMVGVHFGKFCRKHKLSNAVQNSELFVKYLSGKYD